MEYAENHAEEFGIFVLGHRESKEVLSWGINNLIDLTRVLLEIDSNRIEWFEGGPSLVVKC